MHVRFCGLATGSGRRLFWLIALVAPVLLAACDEENTYVPPPLPKVTVASPLIQDVTEYLESTGTLVAYAQTEVRARVPGILKSMNFEPGTPVEKDELLFVIDPDEYEAQVKAAEAELEKAKARRTETARTLERAQALFEKGNVSEAKLDEARADNLSAKAEVLVRQANLTRAQINLGYTQVTAPISGRVGRNLIDVGNLVGEGEATILTDITTYDPIYVYFEVNERDLLEVASKQKEEEEEEESAQDRRAGKRSALPLELGLANETGYPRVGITDFAESQVDADTGTLRVRGVFDNPGRRPDLFPGLFVRVRIPYDKSPDMPLVTERAIGFDQSGQYVLVVNQENTVEKRDVTLGRIVDGLRVIVSGLEPDDLVVVNGLQRAREGAEVEFEQIEMASLASSAIEQLVDTQGSEGNGAAAEGGEAAADGADVGAAEESEVEGAEDGAENADQSQN